MSVNQKIANLEREIQEIKKSERDKRMNLHAAKTISEWPYHLDNDGEAKLMTHHEIAEGVWEIGLDEYGFVGFGLDYGTGGAWALASKTNNKTANRALVKYHDALSDLQYFFTTNGHQEFKTPAARAARRNDLVENLFKARAVYRAKARATGN